MVKRALIIVLLLAACETEERPRSWSDELDPYMSARGYTMAADDQTILKNGYPVWMDEVCFSRGCRGSFPLVPYELAEGVRLDLLAALKESREEYVADISDTIGIGPVTPTAEVKE
jgi:hypothetical protein